MSSNFYDLLNCKFNIHRPVHRLYIRRVQPTRCNISQYIFVRPAASLARLAAGSSIGLTNTWRRMGSFELLMMVRKNRLKLVERLTKINKSWNVASCWLYSANILNCTYQDILCILGVEISHSVQYARHQELVFSFCRKQENLSHLHIVHASSRAYPASCPVCDRGSYPVA